jgi:hypothetical protein
LCYRYTTGYKPFPNQNLGQPPVQLAPQLAPELESCPPDILPADADLAKVIAAWPSLPEHIKAAILALVRSGG